MTTINKSALNMINYKEIYSMVQSDSKVLPKADDVSAEKTAESVIKTDSSAKVI